MNKNSKPNEVKWLPVYMKPGHPLYWGKITELDGQGVPELMEKKIKKLIKTVKKGEFDLIKAIKFKQKAFKDERAETFNWEEKFYEEFRDLIDFGRYDDVKSFIHKTLVFKENRGIQLGFEQALSLVYNWFNPNWYKEKDKKKNW